MSEILFLSHRIPYPPDKGDKIRSFHFLKALAERHTVHLGTFVDDPADWTHAAAVRQLCRGEVCMRPLEPRKARLRSARGFLSGAPLTEAYYADSVLRRWISGLAARRPLAGVFAFSSSMCQYAVPVPLSPGAVRVADFCDVDSDKWRQYGQDHGYPLRLMYMREARTLAAAEASYVRQFDATLVISAVEADILGRIVGSGTNRVRVVPNGVDTDYFDPARAYPRPFDAGLKPIVFTGAMDYHANIDGVKWFVQEVLPAIRQEHPDSVFYIVGSNPSPLVRRVGARTGVVVTGRVPDVRPYLAHAAAVVAPLRIARGVQNKVLEAMAMARPLVATENALQGIPSAAEAGVAVANSSDAFAAAVTSRMSSDESTIQGREFVAKRYSWAAHLAVVKELFADGMHGNSTGDACQCVA